MKGFFGFLLVLVPIAGFAQASGGDPVPEPTTITLLLLGLGTVGAVAARRRNK